MAKGKKSALALTKEDKAFSDIKKLVASYANTGKKAKTPTFDELPKQSGWLNSLKKTGDLLKGSKFNPKTGKHYHGKTDGFRDVLGIYLKLRKYYG